MKKNAILVFIYCVLAFIVSCKKTNNAKFHLLSASESGIDFNNEIVENDSINVFNFMNIYTGAGTAVGDINNDGLVDVYFSGNMVSGRLYLNKGNMKFEDITEKSGLINNRWGTGAAMVDINQDGFLDIYICVSGSAQLEERANMLYINNGDNTFTEKAAEYGLDDKRQSMHAAFFDYDKDNDLDMYLLVNPAAYEYNVNVSNPRKLDGSSVSNDRLYRNDGNGKFTDVSLTSGILVEGYGLGVGISNINDDSWPDIYVSNDFVGNDILYINQGDGTFKDELDTYLKHTSYAGMGNDIADIDNNGKPDIMVLDMHPEDNLRQKLIISSTGYDRFNFMLEAGYSPQYTRNTLQLNQGEGRFSEIGYLAGVSSTDWSWSALLADYDNDGHKDLYVTNGFLRDLGNLDYIHYQNRSNSPMGDRETKVKEKLNSIHNLPRAELVNYVFKNKGNTAFENTSGEWGIRDKSCSNGATFADLDNDGDLDLVVNNVNQNAFVYENTSKKENGNFLQIELKGNKGNLEGIGSRIKVASESNTQYYQHYLSRGYESSVDPTVHFGLGQDTIVTAVEIWWPDDSYQKIANVKSNQKLVIRQSESKKVEAHNEISLIETSKWFVEITDTLGINYFQKEDPIVDFRIQPILPHMHSRGGPGIAVGDVDSNGMEDFYVGGAAGSTGQIYMQKEDGFKNTFVGYQERLREDMGMLFFDANGDGHQDLYVVSGGIPTSYTEDVYQDRLYVNDGKGNFSLTDALPVVNISGSCVTAADFDKDGDLDLFVGGRVNPGSYPMPVTSQLYENISTEGKPKFREIGQSIQHWEKLTMVTSAIWSDYDNDGWSDLIVVGEFMPITLFHNDQGKLNLVESHAGLDKSEGWWNSISSGDFDNDGDMDYVVGNLGLNTKYRASKDEPLCIYAKDYDKDGRIDPIMCYYNDGENYISHTRDKLIEQVNAMRGRFQTYQSYAEKTFKESFLPEELEDAYVVKSHVFESSYIENLGNGKFQLTALPLSAQVAPTEGLVVEDFDQDGNIDLLLTGNSYVTEVSNGRYDAQYGTLLKGNGDGTFEYIELEKSGLANNYDSSGLAQLKNKDGRLFIIVGNNSGPLKVFESQFKNKELKFIDISEDSMNAIITFTNGKKQKLEFQYGSGYLSQNSRRLFINDKIEQIEITNYKGITKTVYEND
ncbi:VCBS repeat-containing protein [Flagellimonas sp. CMM7]|uniref:VCBS repeat-containing protein n=1 Tax=Flagellimonas sp. CMM7 TaxID=2654676 RepID=UPI0013D09627|nr:VCBS repeat-containing protein [Flagellimonas sp. CMM7]UII78711.1 VCBS repeat-containing protein [Flagellimonas sp. CMM7]